MFHNWISFCINWCVLSDHYRFPLAFEDSESFSLHPKGSLREESLDILLLARDFRPTDFLPRDLHREGSILSYHLPLG
jgi:hypothetical protein